MGIKDIEKRIYQKDEQMSLQSERVNETKYSVHGDKNQNKAAEYKHFESADLTFWQRNKQKIFFGLIGLLILSIFVSLVTFAMELNRRRFSQDRVDVSIEGVAEIDAGNNLEYKIIYHNRNASSLRDVVLTVEVPEALVDTDVSPVGEVRNTVYTFNLDTLEPNQKGEIIVQGRIISELGSIHFVRTQMTYSPTVITASFEIFKEFATTIIDSPIIVDVSTPIEVAANDEVRYLVTVNNRSITDLNNIRLTLDYPEGFAYISSNINPVENSNNRFDIGILSSNKSYELIIDGTLSGESGQRKVLRAEVGDLTGERYTLYAKGQNATTLSEPFVAISQEIDGNPKRIVEAGSTLAYTVRFRNNTQVRIGEGILKVKLDGRLFDLTTVNAPGADFDAESRTLTWKANAIPQLETFAPNDEGKARFSVRIVERIPIENFSDVDYLLETQAFFESEEIPSPLGVNKIIQGNSTEARLSTKLLVDSILSYSNTEGLPANTGPLPLKVGEKTTFNITWNIRNLTSDARGVQIRSTLPENVTWTGNSDTRGVGNITYNERTKQIVWDIGDVPANTGILRPQYQASFQVGIVPAPNQIGDTPDIISESQVSGTDVFTGKDLSFIIKELRTQSLQDKDSIPGRTVTVQAP